MKYIDFQIFKQFIINKEFNNAINHLNKNIKDQKKRLINRMYVYIIEDFLKYPKEYINPDYYNFIDILEVFLNELNFNLIVGDDYQTEFIFHWEEPGLTRNITAWFQTPSKGFDISIIKFEDFHYYKLEC